MDDPAITSLMELYALRYPKARPHYIISPQDTPENIIEINRKLRKLSVIQYDNSSGDHSNLAPLVIEMGKQATEKQRQIISDAMAELDAAVTSQPNKGLGD